MAISNKFIHFNTRAGFNSKMPNPTDKTHDYYNYTVFIKDTSEIYTHGKFYNCKDFLVRVTYNELVALTSGKLMPGTKYLITDYTYVVRSGYESQFDSANKVFGIIVEALDGSTLSEIAKAYDVDETNDFLYCNLSAWELKYCLKNDQERFGWAATNGKGVIYWMRDEYGNEAGYDFKNIKFNRNYIDLSNSWNITIGNVVIDGDIDEFTDFQSEFGITFPTAMRYAAYETKRTGQEFVDAGLVSSGVLNSSSVYAMYDVKGAFPGNVFVKTSNLSYGYFFTFSYIPSVSSSWSTVYDATVDGSVPHAFRPRKNIIEQSYHSSVNSSSLYKMQVIYDNVFIMNGAISPWHCYSNVLKEGARCNTIDSGCHHNTIGYLSHHNILGEHSLYNNIEDKCSENILGKRCNYNVIETNGTKNILWDDSSNNKFGKTCNKCFAFKFADHNIWEGDNDQSGIYANYSANNIFKLNCSFATLKAPGITTSTDLWIQRVTINNDARGDILLTYLDMDLPRLSVGVDGNGSVVKYKESDLSIVDIFLNDDRTLDFYVGGFNNENLISHILSGGKISINGNIGEVLSIGSSAAWDLYVSVKTTSSNADWAEHLYYLDLNYFYEDNRWTELITYNMGVSRTTDPESVVVYPGKHHIINSTTSSSITITLGKAWSPDYNFSIVFQGSSVPSITLPAVTWANDDVPVFETGYTYEISIKNDLAMYAKFTNS